MRRRIFICISAASLGAIARGAEPAAPIAPEAREFFENKIRPVLVAECYECHNAKKHKGGLRLDYRGGWKQGGDSGDAIVPGEPAKSLLIRSIRHEEPDLKMPDKSPKLDDAIIADFEKWIVMGAPDPRDEPPTEAASKPTWADTMAVRKGWWAFQPVKKPAIPAVKNEAWSANPIDRFLLAKMEEKKLTPAADADAHTFVRRLTFALTGLPPTAKEVEAFVADSLRDPQSATRDHTARLLASPRFGEHWGRHWLDLVRYAETHGSEGDPEIREAWRFRDYIIRALNGDVPVDQLIREQIAGDLLPQPRMNADGFNESMLGIAQLRFVEHGFQPVDTLDDQVKAVDNQIDVVSKAFQGLTISCARCHDHKFDPVSQRDFYALFGVFASCRPAQITIDAPEVREKNCAPLEQLHGRIKSALADAWSAAAQKLGERLLGESARAAEATARAATIRETEEKLLALENMARTERSPRGAGAPPAILPVAAWTFDKDARYTFGKLNGHLEGGAKIKNGCLILDGKGAFLRTDPLQIKLTEKTLEAWASLANLDQRGGGVLSIESSEVHGFDSIVFAEKEPRRWVAGSNNFKRSENVGGPDETAPPSEFVHLAITYAVDGTVTMYRNGAPYGRAYAKTPPLIYEPGGARLLIGLRHTGAGSGYFAGEIKEARLYDRALTAEEVAASFRAGTSTQISEEEIVAALTPAQRGQRSTLLTKLTELRAKASPANEPASGFDATLAAAAKNEANPFFLWTNLRDTPATEFAGKWERLADQARKRITGAQQFNHDNFSPMWDLAGGDYAQWFPSGSGLPRAPYSAGEFSVEDDGERVIDSLHPASVFTHRLSEKHNGLLTSPRFKIDSDFISVRASGSGGAMVRVIVDNYPLPSNPIFPKANLESAEPTWVRIDTAYRKGSWAYLEFATREDLTRPLGEVKDKQKPKGKPPRGASHFGVERIVKHDGKDAPREVPDGLAPLLEQPAPHSFAELAQLYANVCTDAVAAWRDGKMSAQQAAWLDFLVRKGALPTTLSELENVRPLVAEYRRLEAEISEPRRAPGLIETAGFDAPLLPRGDHTKPGELVPRAYLAVLGSERFRTPLSGRLELANEIATAKNPLTARVMVNRAWHWLFGRGLVPTVDNFGRLGERCTHPELLDFLAARFVEEGWSFKRLITELVTTRAFQMNSESSPLALDADPANDLISHFRVRRIDAESIRDTLLAVSGGLDAKMSGPPADAKSPRRSIYLQVRRTNLNPFLQTFDAPKPFTTLGRRDATNVPAQSLTMLNSPFVIDQAELWSRALVRDGSVSPETRVRKMFAASFSRPPTAAELTAATDYIASLAKDRKLPADQVLASVPVWQDFAQSMFNLKEFIYVR